MEAFGWCGRRPVEEEFGGTVDLLATHLTPGEIADLLPDDRRMIRGHVTGEGGVAHIRMVGDLRRALHFPESPAGGASFFHGQEIRQWRAGGVVGRVRLVHRIGDHRGSGNHAVRDRAHLGHSGNHFRIGHAGQDCVVQAVELFSDGLESCPESRYVVHGKRLP
ncbi:MAG: hypothetical protein LKI24_05040 [Acidipropionibacterium sp.]|nr:hypothetical protein [Acidipropionibacterium sp.]